MESNNWQERFDQYMIDISAGSFSLSQEGWDLVKSFISQELEKATTCNKPLPDGSICKVKLDCHLHDWRQRELIEKAREEGRQEGRKDVELEYGVNLLNHKVAVESEMFKQINEAIQEERQRLLHIIEEMKRLDTDPLHTYMPHVWNEALEALKEKLK